MPSDSEPVEDGRGRDRIEDLPPMREIPVRGPFLFSRLRPSFLSGYNREDLRIGFGPEHFEGKIQGVGKFVSRHEYRWRPARFDSLTVAQTRPALSASSRMVRPAASLASRAELMVFMYIIRRP